MTTVDLSAMTLRTKMLGALIRDARETRERQIEDCAAAINVTKDRFEAYEFGDQAPSLPEIEALAYFLDVPLGYFWERESLSVEQDRKALANMKRLIQVRQRMIGVMLQEARLEADVNLDRLANYMQVEVSELEAYEMGEKAVPLPQLEVLSGVLSRSIREFHDHHGVVGVWNARNRALKDFQEMPLDLQLFVSKPVNRPYLELAIRLSEMSVDRLRAVAEGLLEITY